MPKEHMATHPGYLVQEYWPSFKQFKLKKKMQLGNDTQTVWKSRTLRKGSKDGRTIPPSAIFFKNLSSTCYIRKLNFVFQIGAKCNLTNKKYFPSFLNGLCEQLG